MLEGKIVEHETSGKCAESYSSCDCDAANEIRQLMLNENEEGKADTPTEIKQEHKETSSETIKDGVLTVEEWQHLSNLELAEIRSLTPEQKIQRYHNLIRLIKTVKVRAHVLFLDIEATKRKLSEEQLKQLKQFEKAYKPENPSPESQARKEEKERKKIEETGKALCATLGITDEKKIKHFINDLLSKKGIKTREKAQKERAERMSATDRAQANAQKFLGDKIGIDLDSLKKKIAELKQLKMKEDNA